MSIATISSKGHVTIPKPVREALGLVAGDRLGFIYLGKGRCELIAMTGDVSELRGMLSSKVAAVSIEDMNKAVASKGGI